MTNPEEQILHSKLVVDTSPQSAKVIRVLDLNSLIADIEHAALTQKNKYESPMSFAAALSVGMGGIAVSAEGGSAWRYLALGALGVLLLVLGILAWLWRAERDETANKESWLIDKVKLIRDDQSDSSSP